MKSVLSAIRSCYDRLGVLLFAVIAVFLIFFIMFWGNDVGLSDNGDYARVMKASSLTYKVTDRAFVYIDEYTILLTENSAAGNVSKILFGTEGLSEYPSIQIPVIRISVVLNLLINKLLGKDMTTYQLGILGIMHALLYAAVLAFLLQQFKLKNRILDFVSKCAVLIVLCDTGYIAYFNSLYGEALQHIFLVFLAAMLVRIATRQPTLTDAVLCAVGSVLFGWTKFFNIPLACLLVLFLEGILLFRTKNKTCTFIALGSVTALVLIFLSVPSWMRLANTYNTIFYGVVKDVNPTAAAQYLSDLGLSQDMISYANTNYFVEGYASSLKESGNASELMSVSNFDTLFFYLTHPARLIEQLKITVLHCGLIRPYYLSHYGPSLPRLTFSDKLSIWSLIRSSLSFDSFWGNIGVFAAFCLALWQSLKNCIKPAAYAVIICFTCGVLAYCFAIPIISNGEADLQKHMLAFVEIIDLMVLFVLIRGIWALSETKKAISGLPLILLTLCLVSPTLVPKAHFQPGTVVSFGQYNGRSLSWQVVSAENSTAMLLCTDVIDTGAFSENGSNYWETSGLRSWLNGEFIGSFSESEKEKLVETEHSVILSKGYKSQASSGSYDFYCSHIPSLAARGYDSAYKTTVMDMVTLPDIDLISLLAQKGLDITADQDYWLEAPYFNNGFMVRYVDTDGYIYMKEASEHIGIRPVIFIILDK